MATASQDGRRSVRASDAACGSDARPGHRASGTSLHRARGTVVVAALEAAPKRRPIDQVAVQRPHVLAVITPLRCLEPAAIFVLFDGLEPAALRFRQGAPPPVARGVEIARAPLA